MMKPIWPKGTYYASSWRKRLFDLITAVTILLLVSPVFILIFVILKLTTKEPAIFRQERCGRHKNFTIFKFVTMVADHGHKALKGNPLTQPNDPRITSFGRFLRHYKLDELPQLINVVLGDMSIVGPRPIIPKQMAKYSQSEQNMLKSLRPGLTGYASLKFRHLDQMMQTQKDPEQTYEKFIAPKKISFLKIYVKNQSLWLDIKIIWQTFWALFR